MDISIQNKDDYTLVRVLNERLDSFISPDLKSEIVIAGSEADNIVLDLSDCIYCDSSGLSAMLVGNRICENSKGTFVVCGLTPNVEKLIKLAMLDTILTITPDEEQAGSMLNQKAKLT
jgi:anti-anti-sigma factor